jgi:hypothetical protein
MDSTQDNKDGNVCQHKHARDESTHLEEHLSQELSDLEPRTKKPCTEPCTVQPGKVFIGAFKLRGPHAPRPPGAVAVNVTSCQAKDNPNRQAFSPLQPIGRKPMKGYGNFEAYYQSGKRYVRANGTQVPAADIIQWWMSIKKPKRSCPKYKRLRVTHVRAPGIDRDLGYMESRTLFYIPEYIAYIQHEPRLQYWIQQVKKGQDVVVYDLDGPYDQEKNPLTELVTPDQLHMRLHKTDRPFGHGYVVASLLAGLPLESWCHLGP